MFAYIANLHVFLPSLSLSLSLSLLTTLYKNPWLCVSSVSMQNISPPCPWWCSMVLHGGTNGQTVGGEKYPNNINIYHQQITVCPPIWHTCGTFPTNGCDDLWKFFLWQTEHKVYYLADQHGLSTLPVPRSVGPREGVLVGVMSDHNSKLQIQQSFTYPTVSYCVPVPLSYVQSMTGPHPPRIVWG